MTRFHVHVSVENVTESIRFYSTLFATQPTVIQPDYAKWMLDDPRVNFAISKRGHAAGVEHLGIQAENEDELTEVYSRLAQAGGPVIEETATVCCYAKSDKQWISDPQGVAWETFLTHGESTVYGQERATTLAGAGCCEPASMTKAPVPVAAGCGCGPTAAVCETQP